MVLSICTLAATIVALPSYFVLVNGQTWSACNPMLKTNCPRDPALSGNYDYTFGGAAPSFTSSGSPNMIQYQNDGAHFIVEKTNDSPTIDSNFYIMWGRVDVTLKAAPGHGIISSFVLQSDDLDEIDWEWIGSDQGQAQSNYFGKGNTETYDRAEVHPVNHQEFHTYSVLWTPDSIQWMIDGNVVRTLTPSQVNGDYYPQTPMQIKIGAWSAGDPSNPPGVIQWSQGPTDYKAGPFHMIVKEIKVMDYSTGQYYDYSDQSGSSSSIKSIGGTINSGPSNKVAGPIAPQQSSSSLSTSSYQAPVNSGRQTSTAPPASTTTKPPNKYNSANSHKGASPTPTGSSSLSTSASAQLLLETGASSLAKPSQGSGNKMQFATIPILALAGLVGVGLVL